jgi:hypothetical protein
MSAGAALAHFVCIVAIVAAAAQPAHAQDSSDTQIRPYPVQAEYVAPKEPKHQALYELLKAHLALETLQQLLSPFRWPRTLTVRLEGCDEEVDAWRKIRAKANRCFSPPDKV